MPAEAKAPASKKAKKVQKKVTKKKSAKDWWFAQATDGYGEWDMVSPLAVRDLQDRSSTSRRAPALAAIQVSRYCNSNFTVLVV